jgi:hypothetical protein
MEVLHLDINHSNPFERPSVPVLKKEKQLVHKKKSQNNIFPTYGINLTSTVDNKLDLSGKIPLKF